MKTLLTLLLLLLLWSTPPDTSACNGISKGIQDEQLKQRILVPAGMPFMFENIRIIDTVVGAKTSYTVVNQTNEELIRIHFKYFYFDAKGEVTKAEDMYLSPRLPANAAREFSFNLINDAEIDQRLLVVVQEAVFSSGVWLVEAKASESHVKAKLHNLPAQRLEACYDKNVVINDEDRTKILKASLEYLFNDKRLMKDLSINDNKNMLLLSQHISFPVAQIEGVNLSVLNLAEIEEKAKHEAEVFYFAFYPLKLEGSRVIAEVSYLAASVDYQPCCGGVHIEFHKDKGEWVGKESGIYVF